MVIFSQQVRYSLRFWVGINIMALIQHYLRFMKALLVIVMTLGSGQAVFGQMSDKQTLLNFSQIWLDAIIKQDSTDLSKIVAPDFTMVTPGRQRTRKAILTSIATKVDRQTSATIDSLNVRFVSEEVGLLTAYLTWSSMINGEMKRYRTCYQDVCLKRRNRWWDVSSHVLWYDVSTFK